MVSDLLWTVVSSRRSGYVDDSIIKLLLVLPPLKCDEVAGTRGLLPDVVAVIWLNWRRAGKGL